MTEPKYPDVTVELEGQDGNAGAIMGRVVRALREAEVSHFHFYVCDNRNNRVQKFDHEWNFLAKWDVANPAAISTRDDTVFVVGRETFNNNGASVTEPRLFVIDPLDNMVLYPIDNWGYDICSPTGGGLFIATDKELQKWTLNDSLVKRWETNLNMDFVSAVEVDDTNTIWVYDLINYLNINGSWSRVDTQ